jgi:acyl carrier protein
MPNRRHVLLREHVRQQTAKVLGLARADDLDIHEPLRQLGLDSLMAVELRNLLGKSVERNLPATLTFDHPTVAALVDHLATAVLPEEFHVSGSTAEPAEPEKSPMPTGVPMFEDLSQDELAVQLASRLDRIALEEQP